MNTLKRPVCYNCKHFMPINDKGSIFYCWAFQDPEPRTEEDLEERAGKGYNNDPKGIPDAIIYGGDKHTTPFLYQADNTVFEPIENIKK